jgi:hypothetical protein
MGHLGVYQAPHARLICRQDCEVADLEEDENREQQAR